MAGGRRYDGGNYQGKDMAHMQKTLATQMAGHCRGEGMKAHLARMALAVLPRGGGDGDAIRMTILDLLRNNGIKEGHRPGIECAFLAQWHQKLHSNTTMVRPRPPRNHTHTRLPPCLLLLLRFGIPCAA